MKISISGLSAALVAAAMTAGAQAQVDELRLRVPAGQSAQVRSQTADGGGAFYVTVDDVEADEEEGEQYWLGVQIAAVPELTKQQLGVEHGLAVEDVAPDSPAAKAEIKRFDILVKADETPLKDAGDLVKSVEAANGKEMTLTIVRQGKEQTVQVTAARRPPSAKVAIRRRHPELTEEIRRLEEALARIKAKAGDKGLDLLFARPAIVGPRGGLKPFSLPPVNRPPEFPEDLKIRVEKEGREPAKIHVERGGKEWHITEKEIDDLPEDIRPHVLGYLGKWPPLGRGQVEVLEHRLMLNPDGKVEGEIRLPPMPPRPPVAPRAPAPGGKARVAPPPTAAPGERRMIEERRIENNRQAEQLDAILKELKDLRKDVDELRASKN